jgi:hypothetical protein
MNKLPLIASLTFVAPNSVHRFASLKLRTSTRRPIVIAGTHRSNRVACIGQWLQDTTNFLTPDKLASRGRL